MSNNNIDALRNHLFDALKGLKAGTMTVETAKAVSEVSQTIINSAKVEVEFLRSAGVDECAFLGKKSELSAPGSPALPPGITGVTVHKFR